MKILVWQSHERKKKCALVFYISIYGYVPFFFFFTYLVGNVVHPPPRAMDFWLTRVVAKCPIRSIISHTWTSTGVCVTSTPHTN